MDRDVTILVNQSIVEMLESYMSFVRMASKIINTMVDTDVKHKREMLRDLAMVAIKNANVAWNPILKQAKELLEKSEKDLQQE